MRMMLRILLLLAVWLLPTAASPQAPDADVTSLRSELDLRKQAMATMNQELAQLKAEKTLGFTKAVESYHGSLVDFYTYQNELRLHARSVLNWQLFSSYALLVLVVAVVGLGVTLSFLEVRTALHIPARMLANRAAPPAGAGGATPDPAIDAGDGQAAAPAATVLNISPQSLQVTSAVTGVVILVISLAFLYLFIDRVLELEPVDLVTSHQPAEMSPDEEKSSGQADAPPKGD